MELGKLNKRELEEYIVQLEVQIRDVEKKQFPKGVKLRHLDDLKNKIRWARLSLNTRFPD